MEMSESCYDVECEPGDYVIEFGKHKGKTVVEVTAKDPSYVDWVEKQRHSANTCEALTKFLGALDAYKVAQNLRVPVTVPPELKETSEVLGLGLADLVDVPPEPRAALPGEDTMFIGMYAGATPPDPAARLAQAEAGGPLEGDCSAHAATITTVVTPRKKQGRFTKPLEAKGLADFAGQTDPVIILDKDDILCPHATVSTLKGKRVITRVLHLELKGKAKKHCRP